MNFLSICQGVAREAGVSDTLPASVTSQTGELKRIVEWVKAAHEDVVGLHQDWTFLRTRSSFTTTSGIREYSLDTIGIEDTFGRWDEDSFRAYLTATGRSDEQRLEPCDYDVFREIYDFGVAATVTGRPTVVSFRPESFAVLLSQTPNAAYTVTYEYWQRNTPLAANADEPAWSSDLHQILVWRALMYYGEFEAAPESFTRGKNNYRRALTAMRRKYLPPMRTAPPLVA